MITHVYTVYDRKALQYHTPFFAVADGAAVRSFQDLANDPSTTVGRHPGDFVLYRCGAYDDSNGVLAPVAPVVHVIDALALVQKQQDFFTAPAPAKANGEARS